METKAATKTFTGLPSWAQGVIAVALVGGVAYLAYKLMKAPAKIKEGQGARQEDRGWNQEFDKLNSNPATKATLSKAQMSGIANSLFTAMDGYGTDFPAIVGAFTQIKNDADFAGVNAAYGIREVSSGRLNPEPNLTGTLAQALTSELGANTTITGLASPIYGLYQIAHNDDQKTVINKILAKNKVKYKI